MCFAEEPIEFLEPLKDVSIMESQTATLTCVVSHPDVPAKWFKEGKEITTGGRYEIIADGATHTLHIKDAVLSDEAGYSIQLKEAESKANVFVEGKMVHL